MFNGKKFDSQNVHEYIACTCYHIDNGHQNCIVSLLDLNTVFFFGSTNKLMVVCQVCVSTLRPSEELRKSIKIIHTRRINQLLFELYFRLLMTSIFSIIKIIYKPVFWFDLIMEQLKQIFFEKSLVLAAS